MYKGVAVDDVILFILFTRTTCGVPCAFSLGLSRCKQGSLLHPCVVRDVGLILGPSWGANLDSCLPLGQTVTQSSFASPSYLSFSNRILAIILETNRHPCCRMLWNMELFQHFNNMQNNSKHVLGLHILGSGSLWLMKGLYLKTSSRNWNKINKLPGQIFRESFAKAR